MVHAICLNRNCKRVLHLDDKSHWNYKGMVKCPACGLVFEIEIREGSVAKYMD